MVLWLAVDELSSSYHTRDAYIYIHIYIYMLSSKYTYIHMYTPNDRVYYSKDAGSRSISVHIEKEMKAPVHILFFCGFASFFVVVCVGCGLFRRCSS